MPAVFGRKGSPRSHGPLRQKPGVDDWLASLARHSDGDFRDAVTEAAALHARDDLFAKHIEPEPAPEDPVEWAMEEASDDDDDAPMPDAPPEPEVIDMPPAPTSARHPAPRRCAKKVQRAWCAEKTTNSTSLEMQKQNQRVQRVERF